MASSSSSQPGGSDLVGEFVVRIPQKQSKKHSIMQFNRGYKVDFKQWNQVKMERENNMREFKATINEDMPLHGAGSEFGRERREEARRKKYGMRVKKYREEDQPWILKLGGKQGKKYKGRKEGLMAENSSYYIFKKCADSAFEAYPVDSFYNFAPMIQYRTLNAEEAEEEFGRRDRTMNYFTVMVQKRLKDSSEDTKEKDTRQAASRGKLTITEDDEYHDLLSSGDEKSDDDIEQKGKKGDKKTGRSKVKKDKKPLDGEEAEEESDEGDFDARELDYISEESSEEEAEIEDKHDIKGIDQELQKLEDEEQEGDETQADREEEENASKVNGETNKESREDDSDSSRSDSSDSDIDDNKIQSAFFMQKKSSKRSSDKSSSRGSTGPSSRSNTPTPNDTTKTLSDAAVKLSNETAKKLADHKVKRSDNLSPTSQSGQRGTEKVDSKRTKTAEGNETKFQAIKRPHDSTGLHQQHHAAKRIKTESPVPRSQTGTPPTEAAITEEVVQRYLLRKPMQTKDLLYKLNPKKVGLSREEVIKRLAEVLKRLNPEKIKIKDKTYWTIKK